MKKAGLILLICIYSLSTFGVTLKAFYCCGKLKSVSVSLVEETGKGKCAKGDDKSGCCKTKYQIFKVKDSHLATGDVANPVKCFTDLFSFTASYQIILFAEQQPVLISGSHAPPLHTGVPMYITNCVFRV